MSLLTQAMEDVVMLEKKRVPDGEGGFTTDWAEGVQFNGGTHRRKSGCDQSIYCHSSVELQIGVP